MIIDLAQEFLLNLRKKTAREWCGPCPECGGDDRFIVNDARDTYFCRGCGMKGGVMKFLRNVAKLSCVAAHERLGRACDFAECAKTTCPLHPSSGQPRLRQAPPSRQPIGPENYALTCASRDDAKSATMPNPLWREHAGKLMDAAAAKLQETPEALEFLAGRGISADSAARFRLGWLPADEFRVKRAWGLPDNGKKLWIPAGLLLPVLGADGLPWRLRVRRPNPGTLPGGKPAPRYYWVPGSGNAVPVVNPAGSRLIVVVESALDALSALALAGDFCGALALGSCVTRPTREDLAVIDAAFTLLVCLDNDEAGRKNAQWWRKNFGKRAEIAALPDGMGKDFGEFISKNGNLREFLWDCASNCCHSAIVDVPRSAPPSPPATANESPETPPPTPQTAPESPPDPPQTAPPRASGVLATAKSAGGTPLVILDAGADRAAIIKRYPGAAIFGPRDIKILKSMGLTPDQAEPIARVMAAFSGEIVAWEPAKPKAAPAPKPPPGEDAEQTTINFCLEV